jgi:hypothetical protein
MINRFHTLTSQATCCQANADVFCSANSTHKFNRFSVDLSYEFNTVRAS